ncbi:MAG: sarcosine oxidase subunit gamma family protein [Kiloniellaceae bacterium]
MIDSYMRQSALDHLALAGRAAPTPGDAALWIAEKTLPAAVNLRGDRDDPALVAAVREVLGLELPATPNTVASNDGLALLWLGPNEWLAVGHDAPPEAEMQMAASLREALGGLQAAVTEVGESLACIHLAGPRAGDVIAKGCPLDLHPRAFGGAGHCAQSHLSKTSITLHQVSDAPAFDLYTRRSFSDYLWRWLEDAGREYGIVVVRA